MSRPPWFHVVTAALWMACCASDVIAEGKPRLDPQPITVESKDLGNGWIQWQILSDLRDFEEFAMAMHVAEDGTAWIGTSFGRLLACRDGKWTCAAVLPETRITGIALDGDVIWLSTSDGIRRLKPAEEGQSARELTAFRTYYEGHPAFVSGAYLPGWNAHRQWGYAEGIFVPAREKAYAPFAISTEHGLFSWGGYGGVWHHFLPHFWGANSPWLDTRELIPLRRPTVMAEDTSGNLWIGTDGDGIVRINAHARSYHKRPPEQNQKDGTEFSRFRPEDVGCGFAVVRDLSAGTDGVMWAALADREKRGWVARFDGMRWTTQELPKVKRLVRRNGALAEEPQWALVPLCVAETAPGTVLLGIEGDGARAGLLALDWSAKSFRPVKEIKPPVRNLEVSPEGAVWALSSWGVFQHTKAATDKQAGDE